MAFFKRLLPLEYEQARGILTQHTFWTWKMTRPVCPAQNVFLCRQPYILRPTRHLNYIAVSKLWKTSTLARLNVLISYSGRQIHFTILYWCFYRNIRILRHKVSNSFWYLLYSDSSFWSNEFYLPGVCQIWLCWQEDKIKVF